MLSLPAGGGSVASASGAVVAASPFACSASEGAPGVVPALPSEFCSVPGSLSGGSLLPLEAIAYGAVAPSHPCAERRSA